MKLEQDFFHVSKLSKDQKKVLDQKKSLPKIEAFCGEDQIKVQTSSSAQMQIIVKLLGGYIPSGFRHPCLPNEHVFDKQSCQIKRE